jgi:hypothetical protein
MSAAATPGYAEHPDADLLKKLAGLLAPMRLSVTVAFGSQADAENATGSPRVIFIDQKWQAKNIIRQPDDGKASFDGWRSYDVHIRAADMGMLHRLWSAVVDKLDELLSWTGVDVGEAGNIGQRSNGAGSGGFGLILPVIIKGPVYNEVYGSAAAETVTRSTFIAEADGSGVQVIS